jgi:hypothetical protein
VHVPSPEIRAWRELINCRSQVISMRTRAKNSLRSLLRCAGVVPPRRPVLWTKGGLEWLRRLELPTESQRLRRDLLLEEIEALTRQLRRLEQQLYHQAGRSPADREPHLPGGGSVTEARSKAREPLARCRVCEIMESTRIATRARPIPGKPGVLTHESSLISTKPLVIPARWFAPSWNDLRRHGWNAGADIGSRRIEEFTEQASRDTCWCRSSRYEPRRRNCPESRTAREGAQPGLSRIHTPDG